MQINATTNYAIRLIHYLAQKGVGQLATSDEISTAIGVDAKYTQKVALLMRQAGLITSVRGSTGGFMLPSPPGIISLLDVVIAAEKTVQFTPCLENERSCAGTKCTCAVRQHLDTLQHMVESYLDGITFADLL